MRQLGRLDALTSLRFFAALSVVFYHFGSPAFARAPFWVRGLIESGNEAVPFFFVLSGFVLAYSYHRPGKQGLRNGAGPFWRKRFARIYPAYLASLLLALPAFVHGIRSGVITKTYALSAIAFVPLLLQSWGNLNLAEAINFPAWSLSVEMFFYAMFPAIMRAAVAGGWLLSAISYGLVILEFYFPIWHRFWPPNHLGSFAAGVSAGIWFVDSAPRPKLAGFFFGTAALLALLCFRERLPAIAVSQIVLVPLFVLIITTGATCAGKLHVLESAPLILLGDASYSLYILHVPVWILCRAVLEKFSLSELLSLYIFVGIAISLSIVFYKVIELPGRIVILKLLTAHGSGPTTG